MSNNGPARRPFATIGSSRLHSLSSMKNRQSALPAATSVNMKHTILSTPVKRRYEPDSDNEIDSENIDPKVFDSPAKRTKTIDPMPKESSKLLLISSVPAPKPLSSTSSQAPAPASTMIKRKALGTSSTTGCTSIAKSRGSPKHKRVNILSKRNGRTGSSMRRAHPPSFARAGGSLPFSIDAALSGTVTSSIKSEIALPKTTAAPVSTIEDSMPKNWFFEIYEDSPEEEAANLMEHSTCVLDISSDDDSETRRHLEESEKGKENIPPPDNIAPVTVSVATASTEESTTSATATVKGKLHRKRALGTKGRAPLGDLPVEEYYAAGLDKDSVVTVDAEVYTAEKKPSSLSKEVNFSSELVEEVTMPQKANFKIYVYDEEAEN